MSVVAPKNGGFKLTIRQHEAQKALIGAATYIMLFGGSRSGKTFLLCRAVAIRAMKAPGSRHAILRFRFNHVKNAIVLDTWPKMMGLCFAGVVGRLDKTDWYYEFPNGSQVWFGGLDDKERTEKILGMEFVTIYPNECSQIPWGSIEIVQTRLAQLVYQDVGGEKKIMPLKMYFDCNPPSKGHWTYKTFIKKLNIETKKLLDNIADYAFFQINPHDNKENLNPKYLEKLEAMGPRMRKRFLLGEFSDEDDNRLFNEDDFERHRVLKDEDLPDMVRIVIPVDPSGAGDNDNSSNDAIGIGACGLGVDGNGYLLEDLTVKASPKVWGRVVADAYDRWEANTVIGEENFGGAMVQFVIMTARPNTPYKSVRASRGKHVRAEPIAALYEQGRIRHVGYFPELEDELCDMTTAGYIGEKSPNRADFAIWGFTELFGQIVQPKRTGKKFVKKNKVGGRWAN